MNAFNRSRALAVAVVGALALSPAPALADTDSIDEVRIETQIWTSYALNRHLRAFDIAVDVEGSTATLTGKVDSGVEKELAEQVALGVDGVSRVDNQLAVVDGAPRRAAGKDPDFGTRVADASITASVKSKLLWSAATDGFDINVDTRAGRVTLAGAVDSAESKAAASRIARNTDGVVAVDNQLAIDSKTPRRVADKVEQGAADGWITTRVKSSLLMSRWVDGTDIAVETKNGVVYLSGDVDSPEERALAVELAGNIRGVKKVDADALKLG